MSPITRRLNVRQGPLKTELEPITRINLNIKYDMTGSRGERFDAGFPDDTVLEEWIPEADETFGDLVATAMLSMFNKTQFHYKVKTFGRGMYRQGQQSLFASGSPLNVASAKHFIIKNTYNAVTDLATLKFGKYMQLPRRSTLKTQQLMQYVDNVYKGEGAHVKIYLAEQSSDPDDPDNESAVLWIDSAGDLKVKITHGDVTKSTILADFSAL